MGRTDCSAWLRRMSTVVMMVKRRSQGVSNRAFACPVAEAMREQPARDSECSWCGFPGDDRSLGESGFERETACRRRLRRCTRSTLCSVRRRVGRFAHLLRFSFRASARSVEVWLRCYAKMPATRALMLTDKCRRPVLVGCAGAKAATTSGRRLGRTIVSKRISDRFEPPLFPTPGLVDSRPRKCPCPEARKYSKS